MPADAESRKPSTGLIDRLFFPMIGKAGKNAPKVKRRADAPLFPIFLKLHGRPCLVVGAGRVGQSKLQSLIQAGAQVRVVSPQATPGVARLAREKKIVWLRRKFTARDLDGMLLVVVATSSSSVNKQVFEQARRRGVLCNAVDDPKSCDFYYPAVVRRGNFQIAISTG